MAAAALLLDDLQLDEEDSNSARYKAIAGIKEEMESAQNMIDCRLDLIEKADASKVGWSAAPHYEKSNGSIKKDNSDKLWVEAEKSVQEARKTDRPTPFRARPAPAGKFSATRKGSPTGKALFFLCCSTVIPCISSDRSRRNSYFLQGNNEFLRMMEEELTTVCQQKSPWR